MNQPDQISAFASDIGKVIDRYRREFDLPLASAIGTLEVVKLHLYLSESASTHQAPAPPTHDEEWQPIETSPKNSPDPFMAFCPHEAGGFQFVAFWSTDEKLRCIMSLEDFTDKATLWKPCFPMPFKP